MPSVIVYVVTILVLFALFGIIVFQSIAKSCSIDVVDRNDKILILDAKTQKILYPSPSSVLDKQVLIPEGNNVVIACPTGALPAVETTCSFGKLIDFPSVNCNVEDPTTTRILGSCGTNSSLIGIGFEISRNFISTLLVCFNNDTKIPIYTVNEVSGTIGLAKNYLQSSFAEDDDFYNLPSGTTIEDIYTIEAQKEAINTLMELPLNSSIYVSAEHYLIKSSLVDQRTLVYKAEKQTAYHQITTVPVWNTVYENNWKHLQDNLIDYVTSSKTDFQIYSGTFQVSFFYDSKYIRNTNVYLQLEEDQNIFPVPNFLWKILYNPKTRKATVFIIVNNWDGIKPRLCDDISYKYSWLTWSNFQPSWGSYFACEYQDAKNFLLSLPTLDVLDIL